MLRWVIILVPTVGTMIGGGCQRDDTQSTEKARKPDERPNIIFLTVDTLRADHLGVYGYDRPTMPWLDEFAAEAVVFDNAVVPRGSTRSSYASMLTGLYPFRHGARHNRLVLHDDNLTLAEVLKSTGYHTAGFVSNFILIAELSGCDQGFDIYDDELPEKESFRANYERTADRTADAILKWLENAPKEPFFLFTNFIDPHGPYLPPEQYRKQFQTQRKKPLDPDLIPDYQSRTGESADYYDFVDRYDAEIRYTNDAIRRVVNGLKAKGVWDNSLVVFTADHGESLGMHGLFFEHHFHVWEETTRVPLAIKMPGDWSAKGKRIKTVVSPMDLMPTVLRGHQPDGLDGMDLTPLMDGKTLDDRLIFLEFPSVATPARKPFPDVWAARSDSHKLIMVTDQASGAVIQKAFYDLRNDPNEQSPLPLDEGNHELKRMATALQKHVARARNYDPQFVVTEYEVPIKNRTEFVRERGKHTHGKTLTEEQMDRLRGLGYVK